jgi:hypothetical protein
MIQLKWSRELDAVTRKCDPKAIREIADDIVDLNRFSPGRLGYLFDPTHIIQLGFELCASAAARSHESVHLVKIDEPGFYAVFYDRDEAQLLAEFEKPGFARLSPPKPVFE